MLKKIEELKLLFRSNPLGFGYEIMTMEIAETHFDGKTETYLAPSGRIYLTASEFQINALHDAIKLGTFIVGKDEFPVAKTDFTPKLFVIKSKHGDFFQLIKSEEGYMAACLALVKERNKDNWYDFSTKYIDDSLKSMRFMLSEEVDALPASMRSAAEENNQKFNNLATMKQLYAKRRRYLNKALRGDGMSAIRFLKEMNNDEYGEVRLDKFDGIFE